MSTDNTPSPESDPFAVLGLTADASEQSIRAKYLELIKVHTPEHSPEQFQRIHAAYQAARDPLVLADKLIAMCNPSEAPDWSTVIDQYAKRPPQMTVDFLLSLGNRESN